MLRVFAQLLLGEFLLLLQPEWKGKGSDFTLW